MEYTMQEVLQFVQENDVKFIRLAFCDIFGRQKNVSIMPSELPRAFRTGISFDASAVRGFLNVDESDLFLVPDPATLAILPWRPAQGRVVRMFCDVHRPDGSPFEGDGRAILKREIARAAEMGYTCRIGSECEFYLFRTDEQENPTLIPHDHGGYCDIAPLDRAENVRREICLSMEEMGLSPESSHHEQGPGQNEIDFRYGDALGAADDLIAFKAAVKSIAAIYGLFASFLPKPLADRSGSGLHINLSLAKDGENLMRSDTSGHSAAAESFLAGILGRVEEMTAFLNPLTNSYARFGAFEAPKYITWSHQNRSQLVRIPAAEGEYQRMELRSPDPACNPYLAFALLIAAGMEGIREGKKLCPPVDRNLYEIEAEDARKLRALPQSLGRALDLAGRSAFVRGILPEATLRWYIAAKRAEEERISAAPDRWSAERELYFEIT